MKDFNDIQTLLDRYWEGETTLEEERELKAYFASGHVDEQFQTIAPLFQAFREEQNVRYGKTPVVALRPAMFSWQRMAAAASVALALSAGLWWQLHDVAPVQQPIAQETPAISSPAPQAETPPALVPQIAQTPVTKESPGAIKKSNPKRKKTSDTPTLDPETEQAMEEIIAALALVSSKIKKGKQEAAKGTIHLDNVDKVFKKKEG